MTILILSDIHVSMLLEALYCHMDNSNIFSLTSFTSSHSIQIKIHIVYVSQSLFETIPEHVEIIYIGVPSNRTIKTNAIVFSVIGKYYRIPHHVHKGILHTCMNILNCFVIILIFLGKHGICSELKYLSCKEDGKSTS